MYGAVIPSIEAGNRHPTSSVGQNQTALVSSTSPFSESRRLRPAGRLGRDPTSQLLGRDPHRNTHESACPEYQRSASTEFRDIAA